MAKVIKTKKKNQKQNVITAKYGLKFTAETTPRIRKIVEDGERDRLSGNTIRCTQEELMQLIRSMHK